MGPLTPIQAWSPTAHVGHCVHREHVTLAAELAVLDAGGAVDEGVQPATVVQDSFASP